MACVVKLKLLLQTVVFDVYPWHERRRQNKRRMYQFRVVSRGILFPTSINFNFYATTVHDYFRSLNLQTYATEPFDITINQKLWTGIFAAIFTPRNKNQSEPSSSTNACDLEKNHRKIT